MELKPAFISMGGALAGRGTVNGCVRCLPSRVTASHGHIRKPPTGQGGTKAPGAVSDAPGAWYPLQCGAAGRIRTAATPPGRRRDRKSTRLNSSHVRISYAVFCLKKKKKNDGPHM